MKRVFLFFCSQLLIFWVLAVVANAQIPFDGKNYANHWIETGKQYIRLSVVKAGIQSVTLSQLKSSGLVVSQLKNVHVFHRGKEVPVLSLSDNELLFYGEPNDGSSDSLLYRPMSSRANPYTSLYSDQGVYFVTSDDNETKLVERISEALSGTLEPYHLKADVVAFKDEYAQSTQWFIPVPFQSYFENQECWTGKAIRSNGYMLRDFELKNRHPDNSIKPLIEVLVNGRQNNISHNLSVSVGVDSTKLKDVATISMFGIRGGQAKANFEHELVGSNGKGYVRVKSNVNSEQEINSVAYYRITYAQQFVVPDDGSGYFNLISKGRSEWRRVKIKNAEIENRIIDVTDPDNPKEIIGSYSNGELDFMVQCPANKSVKLYVANTKISIEKVELASMREILPAQYNYLIITNSLLSNVVVNDYKTYRESSEGGGYKVLVAKIEDIYNQFNYGEISPVGIRRFVDFMISDGNKDKFLLLIGTSSSFPERSIRDLPGEVPTIGYPGSDALLVDGLGGVPTNVLAIPVGRIPAKTVVEVRNYLNKVKAYERNEGDTGWKKRVMHMSGGKTASELSQLKNALSSLAPIAELGYLGANVQAVVKKTTESVESVDIADQVNEGLGMITYFGHGSPIVTDLNMGYISAAERGYSNFERYPFMYFNGCGVGNIFSGGNYVTLATDWLLTPEKGAIAVMANSYFSYYSPTYSYLQFLYKTMFENSDSEQMTLGQVAVKVSEQVVSKGPNTFDIANIHQSVLQGDPAIRIMSISKPDFSINTKRSLSLVSKSALVNIGDGDSLLVGIVVANKGRYVSGQRLELQLDKYYDGKEMITQRVVVPSFASLDTLYIPIFNLGPLTGLKVTLDPDDVIDEMDEANNEAMLTINWDIASNERIYWGEEVIDKIPPRLNVYFNGRQIRNTETVQSNPIISILLDDDNFLTADTLRVDILIKPCHGDGDCNFIRVPYQSDILQVVSKDGNSIKVIYTPETLADGDYELFVNARDLSGNSAVQPYRIKFKVTNEATIFRVTHSPNPAADYVRFEAANFNSDKVKSIRYQIVDSRGVVVHDQEIDQVRQGINEWYWIPNKPAGVYLYKVFLLRDTSEETAWGKIILMP